jgi:hypothetical protein
VVWLLGVAGQLILDRIVVRVLGPSSRLAFAVLYWLSPWRIYFTSFLWNPNYMFFFGALQLWVAYSLRRRGRFWPSLVLVLIVGMTVQLHMSAMVLAAMSLMLWWRGLVKLSWSGVATGALLTAASLVPWVQLIVERPELIPGGTRFPFRSLLLIQPALRGVMYLIRYPSLALPRQVYALDLIPGTAGDDVASSVLSLLVAGVLGKSSTMFQRAQPPPIGAASGRCPTRTRGSSAITRCTAISGLSIGAASWSSARGAGGRMRCRLRDPNRLRRLVLEGRRVSRCPVRR